AVALVGVLVALGLSQLVTTAPMGQRWIPCGLLLLAAALAWAAAVTARAGALQVFVRPLMLALVVAGLLSTLVAGLQVFAPEFTGNALVAYPTIAGRAVGNMRQPNQLSTLLLWAMGAAVWVGLQARGREEADGAKKGMARWHLTAGLLALLTVGVLWTSSRTGMVGMALLALWGLLDRRLPAPLRWVMVLGLPLLYALGWWGMEQWSASTGQFFYGDDQVKKTLHGDPSSSRGRIWANTLALIAQHPWVGVGPGAYNFVWSLTPFAGRPVAFFDHSHNLPMQLAVESGLPFAIAVVLGLCWAFWRSRAGLWQADQARPAGVRAAWFMLAVVGVHSLLEYPLWYAYFLLPAAMLAGWACSGAPSEVPPHTGPGRLVRRCVAGVGALSVALSLWALQQYYTVAVIFDPALAIGEPEQLPERIARGRRSVFFGHHADYALVTMAERPGPLLAQFERPLYHLLDTRLMMAYARALAERGDLLRARDVAARLREFRNPASQAFFAECDEPERTRPVPFQCGDDPQLSADALRPAAVQAVPVVRNPP
ncbi:MAG: Wzy polymerase domain-containing protein, partial [Burkholderiales bacterium]